MLRTLTVGTRHIACANTASADCFGAAVAAISSSLHDLIVLIRCRLDGSSCIKSERLKLRVGATESYQELLDSLVFDANVALGRDCTYSLLNAKLKHLISTLDKNATQENNMAAAIHQYREETSAYGGSKPLVVTLVVSKIALPRASPETSSHR